MAEPAETKPVAEGHRIDESRLRAFMEAEVAGFAGPMTVRQFQGGQSCPTYRVETPGAAYVVRRKPPGKLLPSAHAVDREYRVMSALSKAGFAVPRTYAFSADESILGTMFYVMEYVPGRVFWDPSMPDLSRDQRAAAYDSMVRTLAQLHGYSVAALGLQDFGRPGNYFARQISRWGKQYKSSETEKIDEMDRLIELLPAINPTDDTAILVHGDYSPHNILFHPTEPKVAAVLDWEISTLGHPLGDLTYNMMIWYAPRTPGAEGGMGNLTGLDLPKLGIPTQAEYLAAYCRHAGREIPDMAFFRAYNLFRSACILQGIIGRVRDGTAANPDAPRLAARIRPLAEAAWAAAQQVRI
jgi:aminoglycoside phosphotransferase (APT) family kinase protein